MEDSVRFEFGKNWASYARHIDSQRIATAKAALLRLLPEGFVPAGKSLVDIGSGSGLHAVAAKSLGFEEVVATDYDLDSVQTTKAVAERFGVEVQAFQDDILNSRIERQFDVVYSWGVLHHTGKMEEAIRRASEKVAGGGVFIIAIYVRTPLCGVWRHIKRTYSAAPRPVQKAMAYGFHGLRSIRQIPNGELFKDYGTLRGMDRFHDSVDWLGGYPYESATPDDVRTMVGADFELLKTFQTESGAGVFGTGCGEYVFRRK
nr:class I SAM-dependent methyltransferase [uncultured Gellertiella sp.]